MMTFSLGDVFSSIYRAANVLPIEKLAESIRFGEHKSHFRDEGHDFDRVVEYDPQIHPISRIDWRTRDFNGNLFVREYRVTKDFPVLILGDLSTSMMSGVDHQHKEKMFLEVVGSLGLACFRAQDPMGFIGFAENVIFEERPKVGEEQVYYLISKLYEFFEGLRTDKKGKLNRRKTDFYNAFDFIQRNYVSNKCLIIVISDFVGMEEFPDIKVLNDITSRHELIFVILDDPLEFNFGGWGYIRRENIETGRVTITSRAKSKKIELDIRTERGKFRDRIKTAGIDSTVLEYGKHLTRLHRFFISRYESFKL